MTRGLIVGMTLLTAALAWGQSAAQEFRRDWSGWNTPYSTDTSTGLIADLSGKGTYGPADTRVAIESTFVGMCNENQIQLAVTLYSSVVRFANGDLLFRRLRSGVPSTACVNPGAGTVRTEVHVEFVGGTGRFTEAYGHSVLTADLRLLEVLSGVTVHEVGEIYGVGAN
jgi:hypothetical protein